MFGTPNKPFQLRYILLTYIPVGLVVIVCSFYFSLPIWAWALIAWIGAAVATLVLALIATALERRTERDQDVTQRRENGKH